ncbi:HU family DNA-binding protein [Acetatifactor muris]|uniref:Bacterial DNA-binding protein n=1 Tax=Acetatifactor muris TaxID=879566 RepID=A0A2K4ZQA0_9FIRM|nr:HU family DNA-binding protein [Acetatifactor muris]MCR2051105.1 HU family DNA-binding protein [Acetatifactor muris]SOY32649.1 Bacterial DNA-binding protein [Acetatifactor muris]
MNKVEFVKKIAEVSVEEVSQKQVGAVLAAIESVVKDVVLADDEVTIPGVCKIKSKDVPERTGKIMMGDRKGETYMTPEHKEGSVKIVKSLKKVFE